jgi:hypothetical protein
MKANDNAQLTTDEIPMTKEFLNSKPAVLEISRWPGIDMKVVRHFRDPED